MFTTARRHGIPSPSAKQQDHHHYQHQQQHQQQKGKKGKPAALSAPPTPNNGHAQTAAQAYAAAAQLRPATAAPAVPATFSRATGRSSLAHATSSGASSGFSAAASTRPVTASSATHLPPSVPQSFPTPAPSPSPSPLFTAPMNLKLSMPRVSASAYATPSPLSSGLPSPTLPPLPSSHFASQPQQALHHPVMSSPHVRSPVINIAASAGSIHGSPRIVHHQHHARKLSIGKEDLDYRGHHVRPTHIRKYSVSSECDGVMSPKSMKPPGSPNSPSDPSSSASQGSGSSMREDVLSNGDRVGVGLTLQGEVLRPVFNEESTRRDKEEPAAELEVVRRLGAGSYAIVYLVREVLHRPPPGVLDGLDKVDRRKGSGCNGERLDDLDLWDDPSDVELDSDPLELDGMRRKKEDGTTDEADDKVYYGKEYAVKVLSKAGMDEEALEAQLVEANIHQSLPNHPNIVTLHRALETPSFLLLVLEFVPGEDLYYFLEQARDHYEPEHVSSGSASSESEGEERSHNANTSVLSVNSVATMNTTRTPPTPSLLSTLNEKQLLGRRRLRLIASMFSQMCEAVAVCHDVGVYHRDIKPENFIVTDGWEDDGERRVVVVKLTDFGLSTRDAASSDMDCGSAPYMSYECRNNCAPTYAPRAADVWSLGIVLINMLYHINPWTDTTQGVCPSFSAFLAGPEYFFMQRLAGMVPAVASFLSQKVFCILPSEDPSDSAGRRVSAREFGRWAKELPRMMASQEPVGVPLALSNLSAGEKPASNFAFPASASPKEVDKELVSPTSPSSTLLTQSLAAVLAQQEAAAAIGSSSPAWRHKRGLSNASVGYALSSVPQSRRPASRQQSFSAERVPPYLGFSGLGSAAASRAATPLLRARALGSSGSIMGVNGSRSRVPSCCETPAGIIGINELPTVFDEGEGDLSNGSLGLELGRELVREEDEIIEVERDREERETLGDIEQDHERSQELEQEHEHDQEHDGEDEDTMSRSTSMVRRRKRGARRGKGQIIQQQAMEITRLQQQREELERQVQVMQEQLAKQQQTTQPLAQVQVLTSLNSVTSSSSLLSPKSLAQGHSQSLPIVPQTGASTRTDDVLDSLASASEALARELSRTRNARGSASSAASPSPTLNHAQSLSHLQTPSHANSRPLSHISISGSSQQQTHSVVSTTVPMHAISSASLGATRESSPARSSVSVSLSASGVASSHTAGSTSSSMTTTSQASPSAALALSCAGGATPGAMFPVSFASAGRTSSAGSATRNSQQTTSTASGKSSLVLEVTPAGNGHTSTSYSTATTASTAPVPAPAIAKKTSKWKLSFGKGSSSSSHSRTPLPQTQPPSEIIMDISANAERKVDTKGKDKDESENVAEDGADARQSTEIGSAQQGTTGAWNARNSVSAASAKENEPWPRGRKLAENQQYLWNSSTPDYDRWSNLERERNVSPNSTRTGRSTGRLSPISSSTSLSSNSNNWRHSTLTTSSKSSGLTRYSNGSMRSVSTVATSVSGASGVGSWRNASNASLASSVDRKGGAGHYGGSAPSIASRKSDRSSLSGMPPPNVKIMTGVPWELDQLPRQLHPNPAGDIFGMPPASRKQRVRKPKDLPTINERPVNTNNSPLHHPPAFNNNKPATKSPLSQRVDATRSSTSLSRNSGDGDEMMMREGGENKRDGSRERERMEGAPRKVQKGQINALAKMLSALRR